MPKKPPRTKLRKDAAETAWAVVQAAVGEGPRPEPPGKREKNPEAVERGSKGGKAGGSARRDSMSAEDRAKSARNAAEARWARRLKD